MLQSSCIELINQFTETFKKDENITTFNSYAQAYIDANNQNSWAHCGNLLYELFGRSKKQYQKTQGFNQSNQSMINNRILQQKEAPVLQVNQKSRLIQQKVIQATQSQDKPKVDATIQSNQAQKSNDKVVQQQNQAKIKTFSFSELIDREIESDQQENAQKQKSQEDIQKQKVEEILFKPTDTQKQGTDILMDSFEQKKNEISDRNQYYKKSIFKFKEGNNLQSESIEKRQSENDKDEIVWSDDDCDQQTSDMQCDEKDNSFLQKVRIKEIDESQKGNLINSYLENNKNQLQGISNVIQINLKDKIKKAVEQLSSPESNQSQADSQSTIQSDVSNLNEEQISIKQIPIKQVSIQELIITSSSNQMKKEEDLFDNLFQSKSEEQKEELKKEFKKDEEGNILSQNSLEMFMFRQDMSFNSQENSQSASQNETQIEEDGYNEPEILCEQQTIFQ